MSEQTPDGTAQQAEIVMYATQLCPYCMAARRLLSQKALTYEEIRVDREPQRRSEMMSKGGGHTVPQIWINERYVGGFDDLYALEQRGELDAWLAA